MPQPYEITDAPPMYQDLVHRWGPPLGIEEARTRWSELVHAAADGNITLIVRDVPGYAQWTALVPLSEVAEPPANCPVWPLLSARKKLGELVDHAARWPSGRTQLLSNRHTLVAALIPASALVDRHGQRIDVEELLRDGGTVTLNFFPGESGSMGEDGEVAVDPEDEAFIVTASDRTGASIGRGEGPTIAEAMIRLAGFESLVAEGVYSQEPPF